MTIPTPCNDWQYFANPAPNWVTTRAVQILMLWNQGQVNPQTGKPFALGDDFYEDGADGRKVRYMLRRHPPDPQNPVEHNGVEVQFCADKTPAPGPGPSRRPWSMEGVDVSDAQGAVDWHTLGEHVVFAFVKASEGLPGHYKEQARFKENWSGAEDAGVVRGPYHYFRAELDPVAQAKHFFDTVGELTPGDIGPVFDVEDSEIGKLSLDECGQAVLSAVMAAAKLFGKRPIVYTSPGPWTQLVSKSFALQIAKVADLWVAAWPSTLPPPGTQAPTAMGWTEPAFWQYRSGEMGGSVPGIDAAVDLDRFFGTEADLARYVAGQGGVPAPSPSPGGGGGAPGAFPAVRSVSSAGERSDSVVAGVSWEWPPKAPAPQRK